MLPFNANGPKTIAPETFQLYQTLNHSICWTVDDLFRYATDENHPTDLRLLAWRDILFQNGKSEHDETSLCHHLTGEHYYELLFLHPNRSDIAGYTLRTTLHGRPKLAKELASQLEYNLKNGLMPRQPIPTDHCDDLIEILLPFISNALGHKLWKYHSYASITSRVSPVPYEVYLKYAEFCHPSADMPEWLTKKLWNTLLNAIRTERGEMIADHTTGYVIVCDSYNSRRHQAKYPAISALVYALSDLKPQKSPELVTQYVQTLYNLLPSYILFLDFFDLQRLAHHLQDDALTYRILERHLYALHDTDIPKKPHPYDYDIERFLSWASGFIQLTDRNPQPSSSQHLYNVIKSLYRTSKASGTIYLY